MRFGQSRQHLAFDSSARFAAQLQRIARWRWSPSRCLAMLQLTTAWVHGLVIVLLSVSALNEAEAALQTVQGTLPDDTPYRIDMPDNWNGTLLIGLDYAGFDPAQPGNRPEYAALLQRGFAMAGTTRTKTGWAIHLAAENAVRTLDIFVAKFGKPKFAIEYGSSMGGHTAALSAQLYPERWDAAIPLCGGLAGSVGQWQGKFDALFVARTLLSSDQTLPVVMIPRDWQQSVLPRWQAVFNEARATPAGRARIALAAKLAQLPEWSDPDKPQPDAKDLAAREAGLIDSLVTSRLALLNQALSSRSQIEQLSGGNVSGNVGVDYTRMLKRIDRDGLIASLYRQAGVDLSADLQRLAKAPRISADPKAMAFLGTGVFDGQLAMPVLTMNGIGDPISAVAAQQSYEAAVNRAAKASWLRQVYTASAGHCGFTPAEHVVVVETMMSRLQTGQWPNTTANDMNQRAQATGLGVARFISYQPPQFQRAYTACDLQRDLRTVGVESVHAPGQRLPQCVH